VRFRRGYTGTATHELAHMWFGDLVTTAWWDDIWLNEAFATWMTDHLLQEWKPEWHADAKRASDSNGAMHNDALGSARSIRQPIKSDDDMVNAFDAITYQKGAGVIAMFERWVGAERFRAGIHHYLEQHAYSAATAADFLAAIGGAGSTSVIAAFETFLNQAGVPLVTESLRCEAGKPPVLALKQERYVPAGSHASPARTWQVPVCVRYESGGKTARACTLMTEPAQELGLDEAHGCPSFVAGNDGQAGYYRVRYEGDLWSRVVDGAKTKLSLPERVGLLGDALALVQGGKLPYGDALALVVRLADETDREVVSQLNDLVQPLRRDELLSGEQQASYAHFIRATFGARATKLGLAPRANDDENTRLVRPLLLRLVGREGADATLRKRARALMEAWLKDRKAIDPEMVSAVLWVGAAGGDRALFDRFVAEAKKETTTRLDRNRVLNMLGGFEDAALEPDALALTLSSDFDARESIQILWDLMLTPATRGKAYEFLKSNFDTLVARRSPRTAARFATAGGMFCDEAHARDAEQFFGGRAKELLGGPRLLAQATERAEVCSAVRQAQMASVAAFLRRF
jgi:alanyl aminopeptidase